MNKLDSSGQMLMRLGHPGIEARSKCPLLEGLKIYMPVKAQLWTNLRFKAIGVERGK